jgi:uncharacterized protein HemX
MPRGDRAVTTTREQPAAKEQPALSDSTNLNLKLVVLLVGLAFEAGIAHFRLMALEKEAAEKSALINALAGQVNTLDKSMATKSDVAAITTAMTNLTIEVRTGFANIGGTRSVNYRPRGPGQ